MFALAVLIGVYSYLIFSLGILGMLFKFHIIFISTVFVFFLILLYKNLFREFVKVFISQIPSMLQNIKTHKLFAIGILFISLQICINLIGALGPELAFDALWYHLTLPKMYLLHHKIYYIPGGVLYYSVMPKLTEMLYIAGLSFDSETLPKLIQFSFGILVSIALYKFARKFFNQTIALLTLVIFYSNLVVGWESITAYVDLVRTFFELLSFWAFVNWIEGKEIKWLVTSAIMMGFAITTKVLAISSLFIFLILLLFYEILQKEKLTRIIILMFSYIFISFLIPLPWFIFAFVTTGNPLSPFFTRTYPVEVHNHLFNAINFFQSIWELFTHAADPISPIYILFFPLIIFQLMIYVKNKSLKRNTVRLIIVFYIVLSIIVWYITPNTGGGRFILPYLPVYSILIGEIFTYKYPNFFKKFLVGIVLFVSFISIAYRGVANAKYIPVIVGKESKAHFLTEHLNFSFGNFYDSDSYFKNHIKSTDTVLLYGFHNMYYVDFPFIHNSWITKNDTFNYIAVQNGEIPQIFANWHLIYENNRTHVKLYAQNK